MFFKKCFNNLYFSFNVNNLYLNLNSPYLSQLCTDKVFKVLYLSK